MLEATGRKVTYIIHHDSAECAGCMSCMLHCSFKVGNTFNLATSSIQVKRLINHTNEFEITFTGKCNSCGICVKYCPYGALTGEKVRKVE